ncbi:MAG TPA: transcription elongation factor Spt5 [Euryarchaeota archaeon]|nr:transcription elongation factor Spt5 [Euryarchaeota archaeon]
MTEPKKNVYAIRTQVRKEYDVARDILNKILGVRESIRRVVSSTTLDDAISELREFISSLENIEIPPEKEFIKKILERRLKNYVISMKRILEDLEGVSSRFKSLRGKMQEYASKNDLVVSFDEVPGENWEKIADEFRLIAADLQSHVEAFAELLENVKSFFYDINRSDLDVQSKNILEKLTGFSVSASKIWYPKIYSIMVYEGFPGYVFVEAESYTDVEKVVIGHKYARLPSPKPTTADEMMKVFKRKPKAELIQIGAIVEIIKGPLVGLRGRVTRVDRKKKEVTIEILDSNYPLPLTIKTYYVRLVKQEETEGES